MLDPQDDWLSQELKALPDVEAPKTVVPRVLEEVRRYENRTLTRWRQRLLGGARTAGLGVAVVLMVWLSLLNPEKLAGEVLTNHPVFRLWEALMTTLQALLWQRALYQQPLLVIVAFLAFTSCLACLAAAAAVLRLSRVRT
ncbi:MAG TPA: hypothetical protein VGD78_08450 [Chthoniobacterales bacterium]